VKSLEFIPNTKAATVLALDPLFCFILSFICLAAVCDSKNNLKNGIQFVSAFLSILGVALVCLGANKNDNDVIMDGVNITSANKTSEETDILDEYIGFGYAELSFMACASLVFNFLINYGSVVIFPLFIAVGFTLCLPGNLLIDVIYHGTEFSLVQYFGVLFAFLAIVILVSFSFYESRSKKEVLEENEEPSTKEHETMLSNHSQ